MPSGSRPDLFKTTLFVLALLLGLSPTLAAGEGQPTTDDAEAREEAPAAAENEPQQPDRVYALSGATISWNFNRQRFEAPSAQQAAEIARQFSAWMEVKMTDGTAKLPFTKEIEVEEMEGGFVKARLPVHLMNASIVRVGAGGELAGMCSEGAEHTAEALAAPATTTEKEAWR